MNVTMIHKENGTEISGVNVKFVKKWEELGFEIKKYESNKVVLLKVS